METPPIKLAFIIDNEVADILHTDERLAAIFLSNPIILNITEQLTSNPGSITPGMLYDSDTGQYSMPDIAEQTNV